MADINIGTLSDLITMSEDVGVSTDINPMSVSNISYAKSVILDVADNWGNTNYLGIRSVDFWYGGSKIANLSADFTAYQTTLLGTPDEYGAKNIFDTSYPKTGVAYENTWYASYGTVTNQRVICVFDSPIIFDEVRINNVHYEGASTDKGAKNVVIHVSDDSISDTTYNAAIANSTKIFDGQFTEHSAADVEDEQILTLTDGNRPGVISDSVVLAEDVQVYRDGSNISVTDAIVLSESNTIAINIHFGTDPRPDHYPIVPNTTCKASFRTTISIEGEVPNTEGDGRFGSFLKGKVPNTTGAITLADTYSGYISVSGNVPTVSSEGRFGSFIVGKVPVTTCVASLTNNTFSISGKVPLVTGSISIPNNFISIEGYVPHHTAEITLAVNATITVSGKVPVAYGSIGINEITGITISGNVPVVKPTYEGILLNGNFIVISGNVPVVSMDNPTGDTNINSNKLSEDTRFTDYELQYQRWPDEV